MDKEDISHVDLIILSIENRSCRTNLLLSYTCAFAIFIVDLIRILFFISTYVINCCFRYICYI